MNIKVLGDGKRLAGMLKGVSSRLSTASHCVYSDKSLGHSGPQPMSKKVKNWLRKSPKSVLALTPVNADENGCQHVFLCLSPADLWLSGIFRQQ